MPGQLRIRAPHVATAGRPFDCAVEITGALPGDTVTIRLWQTAGVHPLLDRTSQAVIDHQTNGTAVFLDVALVGPCRAHLLADDTMSAVPLAQDDMYIEVMP